MTRERLEWIALIALVVLIGGGWIFLSRETDGQRPARASSVAPAAPQMTAAGYASVMLNCPLLCARPS